MVPCDAHREGSVRNIPPWEPWGADRDGAGAISFLPPATPHGRFLAVLSPHSSSLASTHPSWAPWPYSSPLWSQKSPPVLSWPFPTSCCLSSLSILHHGPSDLPLAHRNISGLSSAPIGLLLILRDSPCFRLQQPPSMGDMYTRMDLIVVAMWHSREQIQTPMVGYIWNKAPCLQLVVDGRSYRSVLPYQNEIVGS
ncbi:hypothetical protein EX30DRAFT_18021 [Ascodesmis nigricans]|uniref:Uncharacterized protein n=1 Tax=Ascodesmis nigricans TaxID=341454 RepID=A0A4S2N755_9PEZI|nr:hypothetical protein EX30DRAFT_18021 [Ascodesmis nigricans]